MKLRNKETGRIIDLSVKYENDELRTFDINTNTDKPITLAQLNEEWEDYEEPKEPNIYYFIDIHSEVKEMKDLCFDWQNKMREIGNHFETREEAEQAVEKLKAWKRLIDKGLTFCGWKITDDGCSVDIETTLDAEIVRALQKYITNDLTLLFGGENEN